MHRHHLSSASHLPGTLQNPHGHDTTIIKHYFTIKETQTPKVKKLSQRAEG